MRMPENASHIIVHHFVDSSSSLNFAVMTFCVILIVVVIILLVIVIGVLVYVMTSSKNCRRSKKISHSRQPLKSRENHAFENLVDEISSCNAVSTPASTMRDFGDNVNPNVQSIPLTTLKKQNKANDRSKDSSESSAGLYDVLFPDQHDGEIIYDPPTKLVTFAGQVYASSKQNTRGNTDSGPSGSGLNCEVASGSLDWDYFQQNTPGTSPSSEIESEVNPKVIYNVCWV